MLAIASDRKKPQLASWLAQAHIIVARSTRVGELDFTYRLEVERLHQIGKELEGDDSDDDGMPALALVPPAAPEPKPVAPGDDNDDNMPALVPPAAPKPGRAAPESAAPESAAPEPAAPEPAAPEPGNPVGVDIGDAALMEGDGVDGDTNVLMEGGVEGADAETVK